MRTERKGGKSEEFGLIELVQFLLKCAPTLLIFVAVAGVYTYFRYSRDPSYTADGMFMVESSKNNRVQAVTEKLAGLAGSQSEDTEGMIDKFFLLIYSRDFNVEVAKAIKNSGKFEEVAKTIAAPGTQITTVEELGDRIFALVIVEKSSPATFKMNVSLSSPDRAVKGLNYMMDSFSSVLLGRESRDLQDAKGVLDHESAEAEARLKAIDEQIVDFTSQQPGGHLGMRNSPAANSEDKMEESVLAMRGQLSELRSLIADAKAQLAKDGGENFLPTDKYGSGASLVTLSRQEYILSLRLDTSQKLLAELRNTPDDRERAQRVVEDLYKRKEFEYHIYSDLRKESLNIDIQASSARNKIKILDRPTIGAVRTGENLKPLMIKRCFMAALVALMIVFFREMFNPLIRDRRELDNLGLYYVGSVPNMNRNKRVNISRSIRDSIHWLKHLGEPRRRAATMNTYFEMIFKNIAARILNYHDGNKPAPKVISVMSSASAEGKTTLAESLARVLAKSGKRTLLVDCDLRRRTLSRRMSFSNDVGLSDFLQNSAEKFKNPVVKIVDKNLEFIPAGTSTVDAMELISGANYTDFLEAMRHHYEIILIDTPPCIPCSEVIPLANASDMVMLSVNLDTTILSNVEDTIEKLNLRDKVPLAYALNMDSAAESFSYYSDYFILPQRPVKTAV